MFSSNQMFLSSLPGKGTCFSQAWVNEKEARKGWERNHGGKLPLVSKLCHGGHRLPSDEFITPMWCHFRLNQLDQGLPVSWKMLVLLTFLLIINSGQNRNNHYLRALESDIEHEKKKPKTRAKEVWPLQKREPCLSGFCSESFFRLPHTGWSWSGTVVLLGWEVRGQSSGLPKKKKRELQRGEPLNLAQISPKPLADP